METIKPRTASTAGTTDCGRTSRRAFGLRRSGRTTEAVWCPEVSRVVRATRSRQWLSQGSSCSKVLDAWRRADSLRGQRVQSRAVEPERALNGCVQTSPFHIAAKRPSADSMISFLGVGVTGMGLGEIDRQNIFWSEML